MGTSNDNVRQPEERKRQYALKTIAERAAGNSLILVVAPLPPCSPEFRVRARTNALDRGRQALVLGFGEFGWLHFRFSLLRLSERGGRRAGAVRFKPRGANQLFKAWPRLAAETRGAGVRDRKSVV